ncbi:helix-turn-helix domain-containing protein [Seohaeicola nanhaiensis]|uniref:Helix-turn-helix domain-containing protein n=1 Tax=Seohaeicola nanhaiensis TaxID=1387282 RepID=A0ABV9KDU9_9RHOB
MSHRATTWLADLDAHLLGASEFRVLFHLCDCHNPSQGCFPTQAYLLKVCGVSNGTLNNALNALETKGIIRRHRERDGNTHRQRPTRYILGFELDEPQKPSPHIGAGKPRKPSPRNGVGNRAKPTPNIGAGTRQEPTPNIGDGADSNLGGEPSPISGVSRLQPAGERTCNKPVTNPRAHTRGPFFTAEERGMATDVARHIRSGGAVNFDQVPKRVCECLVSEKLISEDEIHRNGLS